MLSNKQERTFSNAPLRDQWEKRAQNIAAQCKQEAEWKEKSVKLLFSKWTYHLAISHGDKLSDLKKLTNSTNEEETKPKMKFKIVPPPPRIKHEPALPPPSPRKKASSGPRRPKRKVNVDMFNLYWRESWMSLKPPKYLYLKTKEMKTRIPGFTTIELPNNRRYKRTWSGSLAELMCLHEKWTHSWKQVKSPAQLENSEEKQLQWEILFESNLPCKPEIEEYFLPVWARTWKFMNFAFRQQKQNWDCIWLDYQQILSNKFDKVQQLEEQEEPSDWEDSCQLSESRKTTNTAVMLTLNNVFQPGWTNSWLLTVAPLQEDEEYRKNWSSCWGFRQQIRWCKASQQSQYQHSNMLMRRRKIMNLLLTSRLDKITNSTEWSEVWRMPKLSGRLEEDEPEDEEEMDIEEKMDTEGEEEDEEVDPEEDVNVDDEEEWDEGVDEEKEDVGKEDEENIGKNEQYEQIHKECPEEIYKKEDKEISKMNEQVEDNNGEEEEEGVDEEEEEDKEVNKENKKEVEEEDKISNEKDKESEVDKEKEEEDADKEGEDSDSDEEEAIDEETDKDRKEEPKVDKPVKNVVNEKDEDNDNVEEAGTEIEEDGGEEEKEDDVEKDQDREEETEVEEEEEEVNEKVKVHKKDDKTKEEEEEETDEKEETDEEDEVTASSEENGSHEEMHKKEDNVVEKEKEKKKQRKGVKRKPDVPLHLQFHKLNMSFSSWNQSWMVAVAHRGGDGNEEEEDEAEEKEEWWPWKESWRICRWRKLDEDEVVYFPMEHRTQRHLGLMHEEDGMPRSKWTFSWKMTNAAEEEEDTEEEDEEEEEEEET